MIEKVLKKILNRGKIIHKELIATDVYSFTIQSPKIQHIKYLTGQHIRVFFGDKSDVSGKDNIRTYSIWEINHEKGTIRVGACCHTSGPGSHWIKEIKVGDEVFFSSPKGKFTLDTSFDKYIFLGDSSALAHLYELHRNLPNGKKIKGIIYANQKNDLFPDIKGTMPFAFYEFEGDLSSGIINLLADGMTIDDSTVVYIGGDGRVCVALNNNLIREKKMSRKQIKTKPFWMPGKKGLE
ncbi:MAG: siderophore-interacting protein [Cyclobacteriaceae bacterium]